MTEVESVPETETVETVEAVEAVEAAETVEAAEAAEAVEATEAQKAAAEGDAEALHARLEAIAKEACPCGSGDALESCCAPALRGDKAPETAVECLRARYTAYVVEAVDFIVSTHHPETRGELSRESVQSWSADAQWLSLEVLGTDGGGADDDEGLVRFRARYRQKGYVFEHLEHAQFRRHEGSWCFLDADTPPHRNEQPKVGRNDPCPCGSKKKYKRCCGR